MKTEAKIEERIAKLKKRRLEIISSNPVSEDSHISTLKEFTRLNAQIDTLKWVLVKGYTIWLEP